MRRANIVYSSTVLLIDVEDEYSEYNTAAVDLIRRGGSNHNDKDAHP